MVGDERWRVVSRAGAPLPVSSRSGVDAIKEVGGVSPRRGLLCGLYHYGGSRTRVPLRRNRAAADPAGLVPGGAVRGPRRGGARRETGGAACCGAPPCLASARPRDVACETMRTASEASRCRRPFVGGGAVPAGRCRLCVVPLGPVPPLRPLGLSARGARVDGALRCGGLHECCAVECRRASTGRDVVRRRVPSHPSRVPLAAASTRCRTMAPPSRCSGRAACVSSRAVACDRRGPPWPLAPPSVFGSPGAVSRVVRPPQPRRERGVGTRGLRAARVTEDSYLVDPASSHMLVSKIKPCMCKYKLSCTVKLRMAH